MNIAIFLILAGGAWLLVLRIHRARNRGAPTPLRGLLAGIALVVIGIVVFAVT